MNTVKAISWISIISLLGSCANLTGGSAGTETPVPVHYQDRSVLTGEPCASPCWYGLVPGKSSPSEAIDVLQNLGFIDNSSITTRNVGYVEPATGEHKVGMRTIGKCVLPANEDCVSLTFVDRTLRNIVIVPNYPVSLGEIANTLGEPEFLHAFILGAERQYCAVDVAWPSSQVIATHNEENGKVAIQSCQDLAAGSKVDSTWLVHAVQYQFEGWFAYAGTEDLGVPWPGFR